MHRVLYFKKPKSVGFMIKTVFAQKARDIDFCNVRASSKRSSSARARQFEARSLDLYREKNIHLNFSSSSSVSLNNDFNCSSSDGSQTQLENLETGI